MTQKIKRLEAHVANQIAAGEVVQRPASLVKELLENAVDAGATEISLHIKEGGKIQVQVIDNGHGMSLQDALLCFERHATSKLILAEDLFNLSTKGFRGEALASIAAIAQVVLKTKTSEDELGTEIKISAGNIQETNQLVVSKGSSFTVNNLFFNIPARRNFLKSKQIEQRHITDEFHRLALAHPEISFSFYADGDPFFVLPTGSFNQRIVQIFGKKIQDKLVPVTEETPQLKISGYILRPEAAKKSKGNQFFFVNKRFIKSSSLHFAVVNAFDGLIANGIHPGYFIKISVPTASIDINIHPTKTEIKFEDEHTLFAILRASIKHALGQFNIAPILDFERDPNLDHPYQDTKKQAVPPQISVDASFNPFENKSLSIKDGPFKNSAVFKRITPSWESLYSGFLESTYETDLDPAEEPNAIFYEQQGSQEALFTSDVSDTASGSCFQLAKKYIVTPTKSGLLLIHQSRAHQRILYEEFLVNFTYKKAGSQQLLFPKIIYFTKPEVLLIEELIPSLEPLGFNMSVIDKESVSITGIPVAIIADNIETVLIDFINSYQNDLLGNHFSQTDILAKALAKTMAIKTGDYLSYAEQQNIINLLFACKDSLVSPFGKTIFNILQQTDLDLKFL
jgi:DNA mismatch repair protein MutL